ncbi:hypothetical protein CP975_29675 [Streptomyces alboniger]|uniref:Uncharacterized protein n=1 Tax=Streptomyces alboniger TaxID=132473 RepID=A0A5J6HS99_STRAD|nr:hypothetical protein CP975_29675 [Streptomyces alboniger]
MSQDTHCIRMSMSIVHDHCSRQHQKQVVMNVSQRSGLYVDHPITELTGESSFPHPRNSNEHYVPTGVHCSRKGLNLAPSAHQRRWARYQRCLQRLVEQGT